MVKKKKKIKYRATQNNLYTIPSIDNNCWKWVFNCVVCFINSLLIYFVSLYKHKLKRDMLNEKHFITYAKAWFFFSCYSWKISNKSYKINKIIFLWKMINNFWILKISCPYTTHAGTYWKLFNQQRLNPA